MELNNKLFDYLKDKIVSFEKTSKNGAALFTCPNLNNHKYKSKSPTATIINGSDKIVCLQCGFKGTIYDVVRTVESDKKNYSDAQVTEYLINSLKIDIYSELDQYKSYGWTLLPVAKNAKNPIEKDWTNITHYEKLDWIKWLNNNLNIGLRTGEVSKITVVDFDSISVVDENRTQLEADLIKLDTLMQNSPHGTHFILQYDKEIPQTVNIGGLKIDIRNDGGQILVQPSKIDNLDYHWKNLGKEIKPIPENIKSKLLELMKVDKVDNKNLLQKDTTVSDKIEPLKLKNNNLDGCCNDTFTKIGGLLINRFKPEDTEFILSVLNRNLLEQPMPNNAIKAMLGSLSGYKETEETTQENSVYEYLKMLQNDVNAKDIMDSLKLSRSIVDKYLSKFVKEGKAIRLSRGRYKFREKVEWSDKLPASMNKLAYKIPYFDFLQDYEEGDIILLGAQPGHGKSTTSLNIIKQVIDQGIKPYYIFSESGSRHYKIAQKLGLSDGEKLKFYASYHGNPMSIEIEPHAFTVLDWLMIEDKENTDSIFKHFTEEMQRKGGILVIMSQLKKDHNWYAPNMIEQFPALAARYILDDVDTRKIGHWQLDKVRDSRIGTSTQIIPCEFDFETKILNAKELT